MSTISEDIVAATALISADAQTHHEIVHGIASAFVPTDNGPVRTMANAIATITNTNPRGAWLTATAYALRDVVTQSGIAYICVVAHTSGTFATDLAAVRWAVYQGALVSTLASDTGAAEIGFKAHASGVSRTVDSRLKEGAFYAKDFAVTGNGSADDTAGLQAAIDATDATLRPLIIGPGIYKITAGLTSTASGPIIMMPGAIIKPTGSGYTALTITAPPFFVAGWRIVIDSQAASAGARPTINGISADNWAGGTVDFIRVNGLNGFGLKMSKVWDTTFNAVSIELCGNASNYAFEMLASGGDTCNESHFVRLQVEQAQEKAIMISADTLNCHFSLIHCERYVCTADRFAVSLGGNRCKFDNVRISANSGTDAGFGKVLLEGAQTSFNTILVERSQSKVHAQGFSGQCITITTPEFQGLFRMLDSQYGIVSVFGGSILTAGDVLHGARFYGTKITNAGDGYTVDMTSVSFNNCIITTVAQTSNRHLVFNECQITTLNHTNGSQIKVNGGRINTLTVGDCGAGRDEKLLRIGGQCSIGSFSQTSTQSAVTFDNCILESITSFADHNFFTSCEFTQTSDLTFSYCSGKMTNCHFWGNVISDYGQIQFDSCKFNGNVSQGGGIISCLFTGQNEIAGTITLTEVGNAPPNSGTWKRGQRTVNMRPVVGSPKGWICTVGGNFGTWVSEGNL